MRQCALWAAVCVFALALLFSVAAKAQTLSVTIDGQPVAFTDQAPVVVQGRTLVPVRGVFEALGFDVAWYEATQEVILRGPAHTVTITIGRDTFESNGVLRPLEVPAQTINGRTMLPIRAVLESVGLEVGWDAAINTVWVSTAPRARPSGIRRVRVNTWSMAGGRFDRFIPTSLFDNDGETGWHGNWGYGSGRIAPEYALLDLDMGERVLVETIELDKRDMGHRATIHWVRVFVHPGTDENWPNGQITYARQFDANVGQASIDADFVMTGWIEINVSADLFGGRGTTARTWVVYAEELLYARYIRLQVYTVYAYDGRPDMPQIAEVRVQ